MEVSVVSEKTYFEIHDNALNVFKNNMKKFIDTYSDKTVECIMFGTSIIAELIVEQLRNTSLDIAFIIDNDKKRQGKEVYGKKVYSPEFLKQNYKENYVILIASSFQDEMTEQLKEYGYKENKNIIKIVDLPKLMNDYSYVDRSGYKLLNRDEIKQVQVGILKKLDEVHKKYGIRYYLHAGSALGAVRHKGYIPWDDDVDVFVPIDDYLRLIDILEKDNKYKIISQFNTNYYFGWGFGYMVDTDTICDVNKFPIQISTGQSVDLFPLYGMPEKEDDIKKYINKVKKLESKCLVAIEKNERIKSINELNKYLLSYNYQKSKVVGNILMPDFINDIFTKDIFGKGVYKEFEGIELLIPEKFHEYLTQMYGDYMQLPPINKRVGGHFYKTYRIN